MPAFGSTGGGQSTDLLMSLLGGGKGSGDIMDFLKQGSQSPLLKEILKATLTALVPGEQQARQSLTDQFRSAGGLRSGAYGREGTLLEGELAGKRGLATAGVMGSTLGPILSALMGQQGQQFDLIKMLMSGGKGGGGGSGWENIPQGGAGGGIANPVGGGTSLPSSYGGSGYSPPQPINLDQLLSSIMGGGGGAGFGSQSGWTPSDATGSLTYPKPEYDWMSGIFGGSEGE